MMANPEKGFSLIEVLVTIVILMIGLLGLAGLQSRALTTQMESYQRAQALVLVRDMADRIDVNRANAHAYVTTTPLGTGGACPTGTSTADVDKCEWHNALLGAAEEQTGTKVGAMTGARGCIYEITPQSAGVAGQYLVVVAWQGLNFTYAPDTTTATSEGQCGYQQYTDRNGNVKEALHHVVSLPVSMAYLD